MCSCESRSCVDLVTPALSGVLVRTRKMAEARYLLPFFEVRDMAGRHNLLQNVAKA